MSKTKAMLNRLTKLSEPAKAGFWLTICGVLQRGISIISAPIFTRLLTTSEYGTYNVYLSWFNIIAIFTSLNLYSGVFNNAMLKYKEDRAKYVSSIQGLTIALWAVVFLIYLCASKQLNMLLGLSTSIALLMLVELLFYPAIQLWSSRQRFEFKYKSVVAITLAKSILNPALGIVAVLLTAEGKASARIISMVLVESIFGLIIMVYQFKKGKTFFNKEMWKYSLLFNLPLVPHYLSGSILNQGDRIMIERMVGESEAGIYSVAYNIGMLMLIVVTAINSTYTPWFYRTLQGKNIEKIKRVSNQLLILMGIGVIGLSFIAPEITRIFAPVEYYDAIYVIPPVAAGAFFLFLYVYYSDVEFYYESKKFIAIASILSALLNLLLNWIFIKIFSYYAAGYTTLACYALYCFGHCIFAKRVYKKKNGNNAPYCFNDKIILVISVLVTASCIAISFTYKYTYIRFGVLLIIAVVVSGWALTHKEVVKQIYNEFRK